MSIPFYRELLDRRAPRSQRPNTEGTFTGPTAVHLKALAHGLVALKSHELFPNVCPERPRLFDSTRAFLERLRAHREEAEANPQHTVESCPGCQGVAVVLAFTERCLAQATVRGDGTTALVLERVMMTLRASWAPNQTTLPVVHAENAVFMFDEIEDASFLIDACSSPTETLARIQELIQKAGPNVHMKSGFTPLMASAQANRLSVMMVLFQNNANPNLFDEYGRNALHHAVMHKSSCATSLAQICNINHCDIYGATPMIYACYHQDLATVNAIISRDELRVDYNARNLLSLVNRPDVHGQTPLITACIKPFHADTLALVTALLDHGACVDYAQSTC